MFFIKLTKSAVDKGFVYSGCNIEGQVLVIKHLYRETARKMLIYSIVNDILELRNSNII